MLTNCVGLTNKFKNNFTSIGEVWLFIQIFILTSALPMMLQLLSIPKLLSLLTPEVDHNQEFNYQGIEKKIIKYVDYVLHWNRGIYKPSCLRRSLVLYYFFRKFGIDVQIYWGTRFDFSNQQKRLDAHAWLVLNGIPFADYRQDPLNHYKVIYRYPE